MTRIHPRKSPLHLASALLLGMAIAPLGWATAAHAKTPLKRATITQLRNRVQLKPKWAQLRKARSSDILTPGDQVATGRAAFAEFSFNEGTLARMGERAIFRFIPRSRNFSLSKGTVLLLIPPGQGKTRVQTPNIRTGIRGSALFIRHDPASNTTLVGALTDSGIEVSDLEGGPSQILKAGQMAVAVDGEIEGLYDFDLKTFFESSPLTEGILTGEAGSDKVLAEIQAGLKAQGDFTTASSSPVLETPSFVKLSSEAETTAKTDSVNLDVETELELAPLDGLSASQDSSIFPGQSLGISLEADSSETDISPISQPPASITTGVELSGQEQPEAEIPEPTRPEPGAPNPEAEVPEPVTPEPEVLPEPEIPTPPLPEPEIPEPEAPTQAQPDPTPGDGDFPGRGNDESIDLTLDTTRPRGDLSTAEMLN